MQSRSTHPKKASTQSLPERENTTSSSEQALIGTAVSLQMAQPRSQMTTAVMLEANQRNVTHLRPILSTWNGWTYIPTDLKLPSNLPSHGSQHSFNILVNR